MWLHLAEVMSTIISFLVQASTNTSPPQQTDMYTHDICMYVHACISSMSTHIHGYITKVPTVYIQVQAHGQLLSMHRAVETIMVMNIYPS